MRQALHIFRKDVRFLWPQILVVLAMTALFAWSRVSVGSTPGWVDFETKTSDTFSFSLFLVLSWWLLIASIIYKEPLVGDRQFWLTRPYSWKSLLVAKALLILAFINLPFLVSDIVILTAGGFSPSRAAANLLGRQAALTAVFLVPAAAVASVTRHLADLVISVFLATALYGLAYPYSRLDETWVRLQWIPLSISVAILVSGTAAAFTLQYARRRTWFSRGMLVAVSGLCAATMLTAKPFGWTVALQNFPVAPTSAAQVRLTAAHPRYTGNPGFAPQPTPRSTFATEDVVTIHIDGLTPGDQAVTDLVKVSIRGSHGASWSSGWINDLRNTAGVEWSPASDTGDVSVFFRRFLVDQFQSQPVNIGVQVEMTVFHPETTTRMITDGRSYTIPGLGICSVRGSSLPFGPLMHCRSAEARSVRVKVNGTVVMPASYLPNPAVFSAVPVFQDYARFAPSLVLPEDALVVVTTERPIAHIQRNLELNNLLLRETPVKP